MPRRAAPRVDIRAAAAPAPPCARSVSRTSAAPILGGKPLLSDCCRSQLANVACSCTARGGTGQARSEPGDGPLEKVGERCPSGAGGAPRLTYITLVGCSGEGMMRALSAGCGAACAGAGAGAGGTCAAACGKTGRAHSLCWCRSATRLATATGGGAAVRSVTGGAPCIARSGPRRPAATACTSWLPCPAAIAAPLPASPRPARNASPARAAQGPALQLLMPKPVVLVNLPVGRSQSRGNLLWSVYCRCSWTCFVYFRKESRPWVTQGVYMWVARLSAPFKISSSCPCKRLPPACPSQNCEGWLWSALRAKARRREAAGGQRRQDATYTATCMLPACLHFLMRVMHSSVPPAPV